MFSFNRWDNSDINDFENVDNSNFEIIANKLYCRLDNACQFLDIFTLTRHIL